MSKFIEEPGEKEIMGNQENVEQNEYIVIPNPIYDVVFRYLMEDLESAMIVLSTLINEKIIKLEFEPLSHAEKKSRELSHLEKKKQKKKDKDTEAERDIHLFHLDFAATVELEDGTEELIMIELQKASEPDDIFRFKRYISKNFQKKSEEEIIDPQTKAVEKIDKPIRLIPIFILNFRIENEVNDLLIRTSRVNTGVFQDQELTKEIEFIDNLSYDLWVVQLPNLRKIEEEGKYKNDEWKSKLFTLLKLFDQKSRVRDNDHRLRLVKKLFPDALDRVIQRLQAADIANEDLEERMYAEDEYLKVLARRDNRISFMAEKLEIEKKQSKEKDKALGEKDKALGEKDKALGEKDKALGEKDKALGEKDKKYKEFQFEMAKTLKENGVSTEVIQEKTNLSKEEIDQL